MTTTFTPRGLELLWIKSIKIYIMKWSFVSAWKWNVLTYVIPITTDNQK